MTPPSIQDLKYDRYSLVINGKREFIRSGAIHYFRLPSQDLWLDRLSKLKAAGYNAVDIYFNWGYHSTADGVYDFSGIRDVQRLLEMAYELGLWVIARPGPYINAEVSGGGFPMWLLAKRDLPLRNRRNGQFEWSDEYMGYVRQWWEQIVPIVNRFDNVLMMQIENEYSTLECEPEYMQALYKMARELGVKVPLSHNDLFIAGLYEDIVDLYAFDNYSVTQFETDWRKMAGIFSVLDNIENNIRPFCQNRPLIAAELQAGWFGMWRGHKYDDIIGLLGREHINVSTKTLLGQGLTVFNHYKAIGGTNWGHIGSTETYTSYDFGAPISESGLNTVRLFAAKNINYLLESFDVASTDRVQDFSELPFEVADSPIRYGVRKNIESGGYWLFLRNLETGQNDVINISFPDHSLSFSVQVASHDMLLLPCLMPIACGVELVFSILEPIYQNENILVLKGDRDVHLAFLAQSDLSFGENISPFTKSHRVSASNVSAELLEIKAASLSDDEIATFNVLHSGDKKLTVLILGNNWADRFWQDQTLLGSNFLLGADAALSKGKAAVNISGREAWRLSHNGKNWDFDKLAISSANTELSLPKLTDWSVYDAAIELHSNQFFETLNSEALDFDANGQFEGSAWYRVEFGADKPKEITLKATHIWAVYLNGRLVEKGHYLQLISEQDKCPLTQINLPDALFLPDNNQLHIFVDSLGHPKGFHDDEQTPSGLLSLAIDGEDVFGISGPYKLTFSKNLTNEDEQKRAALKLMSDGQVSTPLLYAETLFSLPDMSSLEAPLGVSIPGGLGCERVNLYLNDVLVGRYWDDCKAQETFYLPDGLLDKRPEAVNRLGVIGMTFDEAVGKAEFCKTLATKASMSLVAYDVFEVVSV